MSGQSGQQRAQRYGQPSRRHQAYSEEFDEQLVAPEPGDQAQRWGTRSYAQQVYGQQGLHGQGHAETYRGLGSQAYGPGRTSKGVGTDEFDEDEPISQVYSEESSTGRPQLHGEEDESEQSGV